MPILKWLCMQYGTLNVCKDEQGEELEARNREPTVGHENGLEIWDGVG